MDDAQTVPKRRRAPGRKKESGGAPANGSASPPVTAAALPPDTKHLTPDVQHLTPAVTYPFALDPFQLDAIVALDECHYINDAGRGTVWEESVICSPREIQMVALSATIANSTQLAAWFRRAHGPTDLIVSEHRPVPLRYHYFESGKLSPLLKKQG